MTTATDLANNSKAILEKTVPIKETVETQQASQAVAEIRPRDTVRDDRFALRKIMREPSEVAGKASRWGLNEF